MAKTHPPLHKQLMSNLGGNKIGHGGILSMTDNNWRQLDGIHISWRSESMGLIPSLCLIISNWGIKFISECKYDEKVSSHTINILE